MTRARIKVDGFGNAGLAVMMAMLEAFRAAGIVPRVEIVDNNAWRPIHAAAGLIPPQEVGQPKPLTARRLFKQAGLPLDFLRTIAADVYDRPRSDYLAAITLATTDSHATKHLSVSRSQEVGSPAIAIGLGVDGATVECFAPGGACYACAHGSDASWRLHQPCAVRPAVSATATAWANNRAGVLAAGKLAASVVRQYLVEGVFRGGRGVWLHGGVADDYGIPLDPGCEGPHESMVDGQAVVVRLLGRADELAVPIGVLLGRLGPGARYADRPLAWEWRCKACSARANRLHVVRPAARCPACGGNMLPSAAQASGLTADEIDRLAGPIQPGGRDGQVTLAGLGLAGQGILRFTVDDRVIWVRNFQDGES